MSDSHLYLVCPECLVEHTRSVTHCADCAVELVTPDAIEAVEAAVAEFPPAAELDCVRVAPLPWIRALSEGLERDGIPHRVEPAREEDAPTGQDAGIFDGAQLFGLYVARAKPRSRASSTSRSRFSCFPRPPRRLPTARRKPAPPAASRSPPMCSNAGSVACGSVSPVCSSGSGGRKSASTVSSKPNRAAGRHRCLTAIAGFYRDGEIRFA